MAVGIPLPGQPGDSFLKGMDSGSSMYSRLMQPIVQREDMARQWKQHLQDLAIQQAASSRAAELQPLQKALLMAQAQSAIANANKANMWAQLLKGGDQGMQEMPSNSANTMPQTPTAAPMPGDIFPGQAQSIVPGGIKASGIIPSPSAIMPAPGQPSVLSPGNPQLYGLDRVAGLSGMPNVQTHYDDNGNLITRYPSGKITLMSVSPDKETQTRSSEFAKGDAKIANEMTEMVPAGIDLLRTYDRLQKTITSPEWANMQNSTLGKFGTDIGRKANLAFYKQFGTPEQKEIVGKVQNLSRDIITKSASLFKGPFRVTEQSLLENMKPSENEPLDVALSKLNEMKKAMELQQYVNTRVPTLIRKGLSAPDAFQEAMKESGQENFVNGLQEKYGESSTPTSSSPQSFDWNQYPVAGER